jgi:hypothetical protein
VVHFSASLLSCNSNACMKQKIVKMGWNRSSLGERYRFVLKRL